MKKRRILTLAIMFLVTICNLTAQEEYLSTLELVQNRKQFLMASQSYGTSYGIYVDDMKFSVTNTPGKVKITGLILVLRNYRINNLFLGIEEVKINDTNGVIKSIDVYVMANLGQGRRRGEFDMSAKEYYLVKNEELLINRIIMPMHNDKIDENDPRDLDRYRKLPPERKFENALGKFEISPWNGDKTMADSEFFFIDGDKFVQRKANYDEKQGSYINAGTTGDDKSPGFRCKTGTLMIR